MLVGSSAWFASVAWVDRIMGFGVHLPKASLRRLQVSNAGDFFFQFCGYRSISDFILPKSVFPVVAILSGEASQVKISMWRTIKMSHERRWRDLLR